MQVWCRAMALAGLETVAEHLPGRLAQRVRRLMCAPRRSIRRSASSSTGAVMTGRGSEPITGNRSVSIRSSQRTAYLSRHPSTFVAWTRGPRPRRSSRRGPVPQRVRPCAPAPGRCRPRGPCGRHPCPPAQPSGSRPGSCPAPAQAGTRLVGWAGSVSAGGIGQHGRTAPAGERVVPPDVPPTLPALHSVVVIGRDMKKAPRALILIEACVTVSGRDWLVWPARRDSNSRPAA